MKEMLFEWTMIVIFLLVIHLLIVSIFVIDSCWAFEVVTVGGPLFKRRHSQNIFDEDMNLEITCKALINFTCDNLEWKNLIFQYFLSFFLYFKFAALGFNLKAH